MTDSAVLTTPIDQTLFEALVHARETRDTGKPVIEDPLGKLTYKKLIVGAQVLGAKLEPMLLPPEGAPSACFFQIRRASR